MGRASITGETGEGLYSATIDYGSEQIARQIASIDAQLAESDNQITQLQAKFSAAQSAFRVQEEVLDNLIDDFQAQTDEGPKKAALDKVNEGSKELAKLGQTAKVLYDALGFQRLQKAALTSERGFLSSIDIIENRDLWCADYTLEATGPVATIEINGEQPGILIAPMAPPPTPADGVMTHRMAMSGAAAFLNAAILPGWQKFKPTYRSGQLTSINRETNTGVVALNAAASSAQGLPINLSSSIVAPFEYMNCNHLAFETGDDVVVKLDGQDWSAPKIIGFVSNPKPCGPERVWFPVGFVSRVSLGQYGAITSVGTLWQKPLDRPGVGGNEVISSPFDSSPGPEWSLIGDFAFVGDLATMNLRTAFGGGGLLISADGSGASAVWTTDYFCSAEDVDLSSVTVSGFEGSNVEAGPGPSSLSFFDYISFAPNPGGNFNRQFGTVNLFIPDDYTGEGPGQEASTFWQQQIAAINAFMNQRFPGVPKQISVTARSGGATIYEFDRWGSIGDQSKPLNPAFPAQRVAGAAVIYRRRRS